MNSKELKRLRRADLLEMLLDLSKENEELRKQLEQAQKQLDNRTIEIEYAGSLAEASLRLNGVFEAAQTACVQYFQNIQLRSEQQEQICQQMERETQEKCDALLAQAQKRAEAYLEDAKKKIWQQGGFYFK